MNPPPQHRQPTGDAEGMIDKTFRWLGERKKLCLLPVLGLGMLAAADILVYARFDATVLPDQLHTLTVAALVLASLASLCVALTWWLRSEITVQIALAVAERTVEMRVPGLVLPAGQNWGARDVRPPARGHAFTPGTYGGDYRAEHDLQQAAEQPRSDWDAMTQNLFLSRGSLDPPEGEPS